MAASKTTYTADGYGTGATWTTINGPWSVMRSGGDGIVTMEMRATGTTDVFPATDLIEMGTRAAANVGFGVVDVRFRVTGHSASSVDVVVQVVQ